MQSLSTIVTDAKESMRANLSPTAFNLWVDPVTPITMIDSTIYLYVKTGFQKEIVFNKYLHPLSVALKDILGFDISLRLITQEEIDGGNIPEPLLTNPEFSKQYLPNEGCSITSSEKLDPVTPKTTEFEHTFDNFIVGSSNNFAYSACKAVAKQSSGNQYNPLFIYGSSGLGKTHLLLAIKNEVLKQNKTLNIVYLNGERFGNELIDAITNKTTASFHEKYRSIDYLLMDDIQFIAGKTQTQEEFFHTFNQLHQVGKQIVLTSDRPPKDIKTLEERLRTRFEWGLLADISPPDYETRVAIIRRKAESLDIQIPTDITEYIAKTLKTNVRQLEGVVKKFKANLLLKENKPTIAYAQQFIKDILNDDKPPSITVDNIIAEVSKTFNVPEEDIKSNRRTAHITSARQTAIYIVSKTTDLTYEEIGENFSNRDHSTITYSLQKMDNLLKNDSNQRDLVNDIIKNVKNL